MELIAIGRILKPIGTRGEVKIEPFTDDLQRFLKLKSVWIGKDEGLAREFFIFSNRIEATYIVIQIEGIKTINEAESLRSDFIFVPEEERIALKQGTYFIDDVIGCEVFTEEQFRVGMVIDLLKSPADDIWVVQNKNNEILIPAVREIIRKVDIKAKKITIHAIEGLL
jgi:16S rRNA processing protein RimM